MSRKANAHDFRRSVAYDIAAKCLFHSRARSQLRRVATALDLQPGDYNLRSKQGGIAVSGEITLHSDYIYVQASQSEMGHHSGVLFQSASAEKTMSAARTISHRSTCLTGPTSSRIGSARCAMFDVIRRCTAAVRLRTRRRRYRCGVNLGRWTRAWRYAAGRLSADERSN